MTSYSEFLSKSAIHRAAESLGYMQLRPNQESVVQNFVQGRDVFVGLPTGSGKSLCYCILPSVFDILRGTNRRSIVVVVSPLIALMKDQVRAMKEKGVTAVYIGGLADADAEEACAGKYQLLYMSPESLLTDERWRDMLLSPVYQEHLVGLVIDEAHCVKKW